MKRTISFVMALVMCCSLLLSALPAAKAVSMNFIPDDPNKIPPEKKISLSLLEQMAGKADDEEVFLNLFIRGLSESELAALIPLPKPGEYASSEEITAYARAEHDLKQRLYPGMVDAFVQRYLDDTARVGYKFYEALPGFQGYVRKSDIPRLIALDEVVWLNYAQSIYLVKEHALSDKIAAPLLEYMQTAAEDEKIPVRLMLRGAISQEIEALAPVSYPTMDATAEDIQAYRAARTAAATAFQLDRYGVFARNHLDENDEILYSPGDVKIPVMVVKTTCAKIAELASLRLVSQIDPAFGYDEAFPDPELPANPAELEKLNVRLREFMAVATHDELIPVSITLKTPTSINSISNREEKLAAFKLLTAEFVNDRLDETDEVLVRSTNSVWAIVPKYKIAQLAALEDVTSISWIPEHSDPLYPASGEAVYVRDDSQETALSNKIAWPLQVKMTGTADDTPLRVRIHLDAPSLRDIDAQMIGKQFSTVDELYAYRDALYRQYLEECASIYDSFVQNYLNEAEEQVSVQGDYAYVLATLSKTRIAALANLNEVTRIEQWHEQDPTEPVLPSEAPGVQAVPEKLRTGLRWEMDGAAEDEPIGILLWLNAPTHREIDATVPAPEDPTDPEQCEAFISAAYRARTATEHGIVEAFVQNHMKGTNELQFAGQDGPYLLAATTKARILALTALDEVAWIDQENWPVFTTDDVPQVPTAAPSGSYNALKQAIAEAEKLDLNDYTSATANEVYSALQYAREALESEYQEAMDAATKALNDAVAALVARPVLDFTEVNELAARVEAVNRDRSRYTAESLKEFDRLRAMTSIDDLVMEEEQEAVDYAAKCLRDALAALVELAPPSEADKSELVKAIEEYTIPALNYTYETCKPYNDAFNNAIAVNEKEDAAQDEVDSAVSALKAAHAALKTPDFAALDAAIEAAEKSDRTKYTDETVSALEQALTAAKSFNRDTPKQADIDATAKALNAALAALVEKHVHDYTAVVTAPTCTAAGYTTHTCACGDSYVDSEVAALGHDFRDGKCTRCGENDPIYVTPEPFRFDDVTDESLFYFEPVYWAVDQKITTGTSEKLFSPNDACTRAQVVTMLWRASGSRKPERNENPFHDVTKDDYYYDAVLWAVEEGITNGVAEDAFGPDQTCTRAQIVTFIWRWFGKNDPRGNDGVLPEAFADVDGDAYYADAVLWAVKLNITSGTTATTFRPDRICTRGQIVTFLWRAWFARRVDLPE